MAPTTTQTFRIVVITDTDTTPWTAAALTETLRSLGFAVEAVTELLTEEG